MAFADITKTYYRFWQKKEAITLTIREKPGVTQTSINVSIAKRDSPHSQAEKVPMGGRYISQRMTWRIPAALLPSGTRIFSGDLITGNLELDQSGTETGTWTVQSVDYNPLDAVWTLPDCLLLGLHPRLYDVVTIQRPKRDPVTKRRPLNAAKKEILSWENIYTAEPAAVIFQGRDHTVMNDVVGGRERWLVVVARDLTITDEDRVVLYHTGTGTGILTGELVLDVDDYQDYSLIDELPRLICSRNP